MHVVVLVLVLDLAAIWYDLDTFDSLHDEPGCYLCLGLSDVCLTEKKLTIEVRHIDSVYIVSQHAHLCDIDTRTHVDDIDVLESR